MNSSCKLLHLVSIVCLLFYFLVVFCSIASASSLVIEVLPPQPVSSQNFTISVYDPTITNTTPYLTNVTIIFLNESYLITDKHPNREIELTAPLVFSERSYLITASKNGYNNSSKSIIIAPDTHNPPRVIITIIDETITAGSFFTLKVTDELNNPIENATVSIKAHTGENRDGLTNESGFISLQAPNQQEITILAQKQGYEDDSNTIWVKTTKDSTTVLLSHPLTPIIIAGGILILTTILVGLKNRGYLSKPLTSKKIKKYSKKRIAKEQKNPSYNKANKTPKQERIRSVSTNIPSTPSAKIEEINIKKPRPHKETIHLKQKEKQQAHPQTISKHHWFTSQKTEKENIEDKVDQLLSTHSESKKSEEWFQGTSSLRHTIDNTIKQKQKKKRPY